MEKKNVVFLTVLAVATLLTAVVGTTFAYFTATVSGSQAVNATSYQFSMALTVSKIAPTGTVKDLIPLAVADIDDALAGATGKSACVDKDDYSACLIYTLAFTNSGSASVTLNGEMAVTSNFANLYYRVADTQAGLETATSHQITGSSVTDDLTNVTVSTSGQTLYLMLYVQDTGGDQPLDQGKEFTGTLTFSDATGGSNARLQATFS